MLSIKNLFLYGLLAASTALAAPTEELVESSTGLSPVKRKLPNKCEAHIHIDTSNDLCTINCTSKYAIKVVDKPGNMMGYNFQWSAPGVWYDTNPNYPRIKIKTTKGLELWIDGKMPPGTIPAEWRRIFTLHYGSQHWNSMQCPTWKEKRATGSNGYRNEYDLWCEFDC
ncbi:hypothetical protein BJ508DRAFT_325322 [Ascobolus immersus RN42]|uniref:Uncharacterized protein n=1 Tax=Ascobolus immersus RN42 TaxID=1160509 RepID=A0A3N4IEJ9_ASCIM|nr:hypothetical protein BJ508DRAFT_325322 [Ascobolus immersus RN42]